MEPDEWRCRFLFSPISCRALAAGVIVGGAYALMCIGHRHFIFGSMRVINFAQGDFLMLGM